MNADLQNSLPKPNLLSIWLFSFCIISVLFFAGCETSKSLRMKLGIHSNDTKIDAEELAADLKEFDDLFEEVISQTSTQYRQQSSSAATRKNVDQLRKQATARVRESVYQENPLEALLDTWIYCERLNQYLNSPEALKYFEKQPEAGKQAMAGLIYQLQLIATRHLPAEEIPEIEAYILKEATANPILLGTDGLAKTQPSATMENLRTVRDLVTLPLSPLLTFQKVNETSTSIKDFNRIAERFTDVAEGLPNEIQWESENLILTTLEQPSIAQLMKDLTQTSNTAEHLSVTAERFATVAEKWPDDVRSVDSTLQSLLSEVQTTTKDFQATLDKAEATSGEMKTLLVSVSEASDSLKAAGVELQTLGLTVERLLEPGEKNSDRKPFDITEYDATAISLKEAAVELQTLLTQLENVKAPPVINEVENRLQNLSAKTAEEGRTLIDYAFSRILMVLGVAFVLGLILIWFSKRKPAVAPIITLNKNN